jgi:hypothetical protein
VIDFCSLVWATPGETLDPGFPGWMMAAHNVVMSLEVGSGWRDPKAERCASPTSETSNLGGVVLRGFCVGCGLVDSCRVEASSDVVVASMASLGKRWRFGRTSWRRVRGEKGGGDL